MSPRSTTVLQAAASIFGTGIHGIITGQPNTGLRAFSAGLNGGISAAAFFSIREYAVSPLLVSTLPWKQYERRRKEASSDGSSDDTTNWSELRTDRLLDSGVSGFATGGIIRGLSRGPQAALPSAISAGIICTLLQYMYNETKIVRLEFISHERQQTSTKASAEARQNATTLASEKAGFEPRPPWATKLLHFIGIKALSDEEQLLQLKKQREKHLKRIVELEAQSEREKDKGG